MLYEVNMESIQDQLGQLAKCRAVLEEVSRERCLENLTMQFAVARAIHLAVESIIEIGNTLIDGFIMRDPGGYHDIIDILEDEQVITSELASKIHPKVDFRECLVRYYHQVTREELASHSEDIRLYQEFDKQVRDFLRTEQAKGNI